MITSQYEILNQRTRTPLLRMTHVMTLYADKVLLHEHHHTEIELGIYSSYGQYYVDGSVYSFSPGDIFIFPSNTEHRILRLEHESNLQVLNLFIEPTMIWSPDDHMFNPKYLNIFSRPEFNCYLPAGTALNQRVAKQLHSIETEFAEMLPEYELMVRIQLLDCLIQITRHYNPQSQLAPTPANADNLMCLERAVDYILTNLTRNLTLDEIARQAGLSRTYFSTIFKHMNGIPVWDFITIKRVDLAIQYLTSSQRGITEIASLCGFNSATNFNYAFKKITGHSPSAYRKNLTAV